MLLHSSPRSTLGGLQDQWHLHPDTIELLHRPAVAIDMEKSRKRPSLGLARPMAHIISGGPKSTNHSVGVRSKALFDLGLKILCSVDNARLELPRGHVGRVSPPFEGCKLLRLHLLRPCWWFVLTPGLSPNSTKLPKFSPMEVAQAGHHCKLELWMSVVHHHPFNLNLLLGGVGQFTQQAWGVDLFAFQQELLHLLVLGHTLSTSSAIASWGSASGAKTLLSKAALALSDQTEMGSGFRKSSWVLLTPAAWRARF